MNCQFTTIPVVKLTIIFVLLQISHGSRLTCYHCRDSRVQNNTCLEMPKYTTGYIKVCPTRSCFIKRVQITGTGVLRLLERGCVEMVDAGVQVAIDTTYLRICNSTLCNDWDGVADKFPATPPDSSGVSSDGVSGDDSVVLLAPGSSLGSHVHERVWLLPPLLLLLLLLLLR
ncbi:uncharacterized protein LOC134539476 [Bacillus rossius redtenbacheri]|uniref:uncharacterized protein LOC134539476 n=1 Tax=Bacillus rossius redtenbacheri TaxID=93214 RepID=UPI002FDECF75